MPAKYKLVLRKDMRKGAEADAKLYYANAKAAGTVGIQELCDSPKVPLPRRGM